MERVKIRKEKRDKGETRIFKKKKKLEATARGKKLEEQQHINGDKF